MIDLGHAERIVAGAVGEPGDRTFYLEVEVPAGPMWFVVEKMQVAALALQIEELVAGSEPAPAEPGALSGDPIPAFRIAEIRIGPEGDGSYRFELHPSETAAAEPVTFTVGPRTLAALAKPALDAVRAGRPRCPRCGLAMDPQGHACPTGNGDLRDHRP